MTPIEKELLDVLDQVEHYLTQRVLSMNEFNELLTILKKIRKKYDKQR